MKIHYSQLDIYLKHTEHIWNIPKLNLSVIPKYFCNPKLIVIVIHVFTDGKFQLAPIGLIYPNNDAFVALGTYLEDFIFHFQDKLDEKNEELVEQKELLNKLINLKRFNQIIVIKINIYIYINNHG